MSEKEPEAPTTPSMVGGTSAYGNRRPSVLMLGLKQGGGLLLWARVIDPSARQWADAPSMPEAETELRAAHQRATDQAPIGARARTGRGVGYPVVLVNPKGEVKVDVSGRRILGGGLSPGARAEIWNLWTRPLPVSEIPRSLPVTFQFSTHGEKGPVGSGPVSVGRESTSFERESQLQSYLVTNWESLPLSTSLEIIGREHPTNDRGRIDILCKNKDGSGYTVIELKKGQTGDAVVGQVLRYMGWVREDLIRGAQSVFGIIICHEADPKLRRAVSVAPNVDVYTYEVRVVPEGGLHFALSNLSKQG